MERKLMVMFRQITVVALAVALCFTSAACAVADTEQVSAGAGEHATKSTDAPVKDGAMSETHDETAKPLKLSTSNNTFNLDAEEQMLAWKEWHHHVGKALGKAIKRDAGKMFGTVILDVVVSRDGKINTKVISSDNDALCDACVRATEGFAADPTLVFPEQSARQSVAFNLRYRNSKFNISTESFIKDDYEHLDR